MQLTVAFNAAIWSASSGLALRIRYAGGHSGADELDWIGLAASAESCCDAAKKLQLLLLFTLRLSRLWSCHNAGLGRLQDRSRRAGLGLLVNVELLPLFVLTTATGMDFGRRQRTVLVHTHLHTPAYHRSPELCSTQILVQTQGGKMVSSSTLHRGLPGAQWESLCAYKHSTFKL